MERQAKHLTVIAKPTHDCNLSCNYCYVEPSAEGGFMGESTLAKSIERVSDYASFSRWIWHGGEPLLPGLDFYRNVVSIQDFYRKRGKHFSNGIQTNATLVTEDVAAFAKDNGFHMGTSVDGPEDIHNQTRIYPEGTGSFNGVMKGLELMKSSGVGGGAICVINSNNIGHPEELYQFFKSQHIHVKFNPLIKSGRARDNLDSLGITPAQYGDFLLQMWGVYNEDASKGDDVPIEVDPFMEVLGNIATGKPLGCNYSSSCRDNFISIGPRGDIYPCGRFDGVTQFWMGNVKTHAIEEVVNSSVNIELSQRNLESVVGCGVCDFNKVCNSGCMHNAYLAGDIHGKDPYCTAYQILFKEMNKVLKSEIKQGLENEQGRN